MNKILCTILSILMIISSTAFAQTNFKGAKGGVGVILGEPTGVTFQLRQPDHFYDFSVAYSLHSEATFLADYKILLPTLIPKLIRKASAPISFYAGLGGYMRFEESNGNSKMALGVRLPVGLDYQIPKRPYGLFFEVVPIVRVITSTDIDMMAGIGGRYYF
ncbi:MAG: hypothetical protein ACOYL6_06190 [Bacteriovoracaceae bacterium]